MTSLRTYLRTRLIALGFALCLPVMFLIHNLYQLGLDDATELYLQQDLNWLILELDRTGELPATQPYKVFAVGTEQLPILYKKAINFTDAHPYFYLENREGAHYGIRGTWHNKTVFVVHEFPLEEPLPGLQLETVVAGMIVLIILFVLLAAWLMYRRIAQSMTALDSLIGPDSSALNSDKGSLTFQEIVDVAGSLKQALDQLELKTQQERMFIQSLSHELRTPMAIIQVAVELLRRKSLDSVVQEKLNTIFTANLKMQTLANQLLDLWQADGDQRSSLMKVHDEIMIIVQQLDHHYGCSERIKITGDVQLSISPRSKLAAQLVFMNLIKNAVLHGEGPIQVHLERTGLTIQNDVRASESAEECHEKTTDSAADSVGLGLIIVDQAIKVLKWTMLTNEDVKQGYQVDIRFED